MTIMEVYYEGLAQLLPENERLEIDYDRVTELIVITTNDVMIHGTTAARIFDYCSKHGLRCWIGYSLAFQQIKLGIAKDI